MDDLYSEQFGVARIQDLYVRFHWSISYFKIEFRMGLLGCHTYKFSYAIESDAFVLSV